MNENVTYRKSYPKNGWPKDKISKDFFENREWANNELVCGIDEVGRGCLAGPLVVAAVILKPNIKFKLLKDSKILSNEELQKVSPKIIQNSWYAFGILNNLDIDKFNIWHATLFAMRKAAINLFAICPKLPSTILIDAMPLSLANTNYKDINIHHFPKGESLSRSIAAASIIAKVKRDNLMANYDNHLSGYNFTTHKGYATQVHQEAIKQNGESILHRKTFMRNFQNQFDTDLKSQNNLFNFIGARNDKIQI